MKLLQAGIDRSVIALWLGHERVKTTQIYVEATLVRNPASRMTRERQSRIGVSISRRRGLGSRGRQNRSPKTAFGTSYLGFEHVVFLNHACVNSLMSNQFQPRPKAFGKAEFVPGPTHAGTAAQHH